MADTRPEPRILVLATGGTIAGQAGDATRADYRPGQIGIADYLAQADALGIAARYTGRQIANIGSEDIDESVWSRLHSEIERALSDDGVDAIVVTHGTDTAEETAFLLDLTLPSTKPVVLVGAMRPADAVGYDGMRNFANAVRVAGDPDAAGRGVLVVMGDRVHSALDVRKAQTRATEAFRGFPRESVAIVTPSRLDWFGAPWRVGDPARLALLPLPDVPILAVYAGMSATAAERQLAGDPPGIVVSGLGEGNMPDPVRQVLLRHARRGALVVRASRTDEGLVDREPEDDANGFIAARALGVPKARVLLALLIANGITDAGEAQRFFDQR
ncbi:asparaginase [Alteriqipengyuania lutimaris]|uniref:Asparaginase n=1 Tax=Alteriqipengyuania lutimaris TaxID=1538146 RepID=A0A395LKY0_9SPHN|nr:asparaginase [Alteriqipengyuania lutimaris]MBB3033339.1 L-asparaginase [Alteriqipengyuania lutimaris]RDS77628.1 asparaginase [Alteriqipengyuania lutimaris]